VWGGGVPSEDVRSHEPILLLYSTYSRVRPESVNKCWRGSLRAGGASGRGGTAGVEYRKGGERYRKGPLRA
jgi:hypothetical protein